METQRYSLNTSKANKVYKLLILQNNICFFRISKHRFDAFGLHFKYIYVTLTEL